MLTQKLRPPYLDSWLQSHPRQHIITLSIHMKQDRLNSSTDMYYVRMHTFRRGFSFVGLCNFDFSSLQCAYSASFTSFSFFLSREFFKSFYAVPLAYNRANQMWHFLITICETTTYQIWADVHRCVSQTKYETTALIFFHFEFYIAFVERDNFFFPPALLYPSVPTCF